MATYILWDIDGTLILNAPSAGSLYVDAIRLVTGIVPSVRVPDPHGMTEGQLLGDMLELNGHSRELLPEVLTRLDILAREQHESGHTRDAAVGVDAALRAVADRGWTNALLTGNGPLRARYKIIAAGIDPEAFDWGHSFFGHESPTRHDLTAEVAESIGDARALIIGDTPKDGEAADSAGIPFIAVATGAFSVDELRATSALVVVDDLESGLADVLDAISRARHDG
jgi:phosphoglycolate phosphatase-like HAD superfamily hydrolase